MQEHHCHKLWTFYLLTKDISWKQKPRLMSSNRLCLQLLGKFCNALDFNSSIHWQCRHLICWTRRKWCRKVCNAKVYYWFWVELTGVIVRYLTFSTQEKFSITHILHRSHSLSWSPSGRPTYREPETTKLILSSAWHVKHKTKDKEKESYIIVVFTTKE